jgi:hypothetical protein
MALYARSRPGTTPSFWRAYHNAQLKVASSCMRSASSGVVRETNIQDLIADFDKNGADPLLGSKARAVVFSLLCDAQPISAGTTSSC